MNILAYALFVILLLISSAHFFWAFGGRWPGFDETSLSMTVVGARGVTKMPPASTTLLVATALLIVAIWPLMWRAIIPYSIPQNFVWLGRIAIILVFIGRGVAGYMPFFGEVFCEQPFAKFNRIYYSPLCLLIGGGFATLLLNV